MKFVEQLNQLFTTKSQQHLFSGAVSIRRKGTPLFQQAYGYANRAWNIKNQLDTRFRIASITKMFTAVAILQLVEQEKICLDTGVVKYLDLQHTMIPKEVTVYHLLTMTSGIADWFDESGDWETKWEDLRRQHPLYFLRRHEDYLPLFVNEPPVSAVGEKYHYNGAGYILLGLIIAKASGLSYFDYIRQYILAPAEMVDSDFVALDGVDARVAEGYIAITDAEDQIIGWKKNIYDTTPEAAADGGATSTIEDLSRFLVALRGNHLLTSEMAHAMLTPKVLDTPTEEYIWKYGYGNIFLLDQTEQIVRWGHTGEEGGVSCRLFYYPAYDLDVILLANQSWCTGSLLWEIHDLVLAMPIA